MRSPEQLRGVILAAGTSVELPGLESAGPRALLPVGDRCVAQHHVDGLVAAGVPHIVLAVGENVEPFRQALHTPAGVTLEFVVRDMGLGIAHTVYGLGSSIPGAFALILGDVVWLPTSALPEMIQRFCNSDIDGLIACRRDDPEQIARNFAVYLGPDRRVERVIEKPTHSDAEFKGVGLYVFEDSVFDALRRTPRTALRDRYELTDALQIFLDDSAIVEASEAVTLDINLATPADLLHANLQWLATQSFECYVADTAQVHDTVHVQASIIGDGARIEAGAKLDNCLVLPGARVSASARLADSVIARDGIWPC